MDNYPPGVTEGNAPWNEPCPGDGHTCGQCMFIRHLDGSPNGIACVCIAAEAQDRFAYTEAAWDCSLCYSFENRSVYDWS